MGQAGFEPTILVRVPGLQPGVMPIRLLPLTPTIFDELFGSDFMSDVNPSSIRLQSQYITLQENVKTFMLTWYGNG